MGVPLKHDGKTVGMIALANKAAGYDASDQETVESLATAVVEALMCKRAEETLREREQWLSTILHNVSEVIYVLSPEGIVNFVSPAWTSLLGWEVGDLQGKSFVPFVHPEDVAACQEFIGKVLTTGAAQRGFEYRIRHKNGSCAWASAAPGASQGQARQAALLRGSGADVTDRKRAEEHSRRRKRSFARPRSWRRWDTWPAASPTSSTTSSRSSAAMPTAPRRDFRPRKQPLPGPPAGPQGGGAGRGLTRQLLGFSRRRVLQPRTSTPTRWSPTWRKWSVR